MKLKRFWISIVAMIFLFSSMSYITVGATANQVRDSVIIEPSEENPLVVLESPSEGSDNVVTLTETSELAISGIGEEYREVTYTDDMSQEEIRGYARTEELEAYLSKSLAVTEVTVSPSEEEPLELFVDGELEKAMYLTKETTLIMKESEGHYITVEYSVPSTGETVEALVLSDALKSATMEEHTIEEAVSYVAIPDGETLSIYDEASAEGNLVFDLLVDSYLTIGETYQYIQVTYQDDKTENEIEGYVLYKELIQFTDELDEAEENEMLAARGATGVISNPVIIDISKWQSPSSINYDKLAAEVDLVIIRIQDGSSVEDSAYKTHITEFQKRGIPVHVYAFMRATTVEAAKEEAKLFYNRAKSYDPIMYWVDVELETTSNMRNVVSAYETQLRELVGNAKVGAYISHNLYSSYNIDTSRLDGVWIPRYGLNNGYYNKGYDPNYSCDIHQYTDTGKLNGYSNNLDLNRLTLTDGKDLSYFSSKNNNSSNSSSFYTTNPGKIRLTSKLNIYSSPDFSESTKTGKSLSVGSIVTVTGITYAKDGKPRLKISGGYISAYRNYSSTDTTTYYSSNPDAVILSEKVNLHSSVDLVNSTKTGQTYGKGTTLKVTGIAYTKAGTPRLKVNGGYISGNKKFSQQYYTANPETVYLTSNLNVYSSTAFSESTKTGKKYLKGTTLKVTGIEYTKSGAARLKVSGGYVSGNAAYSQQYISMNPGTVKIASKVNVHRSPDMTDSNKTGKTYAKGAMVKVTGIAYSSNGTPRLKVDGGYISANAKFFQ